MEATVNCPSCGKSVPLKKFCNYCGANLEESKAGNIATPTTEQVATPIVSVSKPEAEKAVVKIAPVETIVNSLKIDFVKAKTMAEEKKLSFFTAFGLFKPKPEEVECDSFTAGYEVFLRVKGSYHIDYHRTALYNITIEDQVKEVIILGQTFTPIKVGTKSFLGISGGGKTTNGIRLEGEERMVNDFSADILYDDSGNRTDHPLALNAEANPEGEKILKAGINVDSLHVPPEAIVENFKPMIFQRPTDVYKTVEEVLDISEVSLIYNPVYRARYVNKRSKEIKQLRIDGVSGEVILAQKASEWEMLCPGCGEKFTLEEKFCGGCGTKLLI